MLHREEITKNNGLDIATPKLARVGLQRLPIDFIQLAELLNILENFLENNCFPPAQHVLVLAGGLAHSLSLQAAKNNLETFLNFQEFEHNVFLFLIGIVHVGS